MEYARLLFAIQIRSQQATARIALERELWHHRSKVWLQLIRAIALKWIATEVVFFPITKQRQPSSLLMPGNITILAAAVQPFRKTSSTESTVYRL